VRKGGMDYLFQILFYVGINMEYDDQTDMLIITYLTEVLYEICYRNCTMDCPRHTFLGKVLSMLKNDEYKKRWKRIIFQNNDILSMSFIPTNLLIHEIRINAAFDESLIAVDFIDELPRNVVSVCSMPLIGGYIRNESVSSPDIPDDIIPLIAFFF